MPHDGVHQIETSLLRERMAIDSLTRGQSIGKHTEDTIPIPSELR